MRAGRLDRQVTIQRKTVTLLSSGQPVETWAALATVFASVSPVSGSERFSVPQIGAKQLSEFQVRWSSTVSDVHPQDRIVYPYGSADAVAVYDILEVHEIGRREGLKIIAERNPDADVTTLTEFDADMQAIFDGFTTPPSDARKILIKDLVATLKAADAWSKARVLYVHAAADSQAALINWVTPGTFTAVLSGSTLPTFAADRGFTGDGVTSTGGWIDSGYTPANDAVVQVGDYCQFAHVLAYGGASPAAFEPMVGTTLGGGCVIQRTNTGTVAAQIHSPNAAQITVSGDYTGQFAASTTGLSGVQQKHYWNGVLRAAGGGPSAAKVTGTFAALRNAGTGRGPFEIAAMGVFQSLTEVQHVALYNAMRTYLQGVGAI